MRNRGFFLRYPRLKKSKGFTLVEVLVVIVIISILAVIAVPAFANLAQKAKVSATQGALDAVRGALNLRYAVEGVFPAALTSADFTGGGNFPVNKLTDNGGIGTVASTPAGAATHASNGFWYIVANGEAGAYSDGTEDTSSW